MATSSTAITFIIPGQAQSVDAGATRGAAAAALPSGLTQGQLMHSVLVGAQRGGGGGEVRVSAVPGEDVVVLHIAGGPTLTLHPETVRDLMLAQNGAPAPTRGARGADAAPTEVKVQAQLQWRGLEQGVPTRGATRGFMGDVLLQVFDVVKGPAANLVAAEVVKRVDAQVEAGVYQLAPEALPKLKGSGALLAKVPAAADGAPMLVFLHGTFSTTEGTFSKLWTQHPQRVRSLFQKYGNCVYGLDHPTLGASPIDNALTLVQALPQGARLHLVTHSRGGLVGEVLARVCGRPVLTPQDLSFFKGDAYKDHRVALGKLTDMVKAKGIRVERIVRVACPARGTLLASKRLDAYLSVFKWTLELAAIPVAPEIVDFLSEVAQRRADPLKIPGLEAQIPDGAMVQWLHAVDEAIPGELRVVAGDIEGDSVTSWLKTLLADAYYWTDNDFVVQTRSMYGGAPRAAGASFMLDQGGKVSHFNYFSNERTAEAIVSALVQDAPQGFRVIGQLSWSGESSTGVRGAARAALDAKPVSDKPAVFVLPGILGSNLKVGGKRIWLGWRLINGLARLDYQAGRPDGVEPDGPIGLSYDDLVEYLSQTHEAIEFAYDWRKPIEAEARRLGQAVEAALVARELSGQPVRLLAHSMGGLLARTMQLECKAIWERMMARPGARMLMLGTPNGGSWAPMQVLSGDDTFGNTLVAFGAPFQDHSARELMARFPGFIQLQADLLDKTKGLDRHETWQKLADDDLARVRQHNVWHSDDRQLGAYTWGVPPQDVLDQAVALRKRLDVQRDTELKAWSDKLLLVVGQARFTPDGYELGDDGLVYLDAPEAGDGRVTLASARLPGVRTWQLDCEHGKLPDKASAFDAYRDLLVNGSTNLLSPLPDAVPTRGAAASIVAHVRSRPSRTRLAGLPPQSTRELLDVETGQASAGPAARGTALRITVTNGDLMFVRQPLMVGHYRAMRLTGTERVVDKLVGGSMSESLKVGLYPDPPGTHQMFMNCRADADNPWQLPRPEAVVVAGLGEEGKLRPTDLALTVRQAVIAWAQRISEKSAGAPALFELATTLIGSGGTGINVAQSAQLIAQGVREANLRLADCKWPQVSHLYLIELYLDRASEAWRALQLQSTATLGHYVVSETVTSGPGALRRPLTSGYRGADYDFITALAKGSEQGDAVIEYTLDTKRARTEVRAQQTQGRLLRELVARASNDKNSDTQIGRTLFQLLVPPEMEPFLGGTTEMVIELNSGTAGIPWELLDTDVRGGGDSRPWAIRAKLLRKLRTTEFRAQVADANPDASVLVIGEPQCDPDLYLRLAGARNEARAVVKRLTAPGALPAEGVRSLISPDDPAQTGPDARTVINALLERDWRIVHIAGHGEQPEKLGPEPKKVGDPPQRDGDPRGVVLSNGTFLGPREIRNMRVVPELVFVNCCHLAERNTDQLLRSGAEYDRAHFAAGVAEELIKIGVRCVIAAGWAVEDGPAMNFATTFYESLLRGRRFIDAVADARETAKNLGGNTWAAYQCYGDPDWFFSRHGADAQRAPLPLADEFAGVASPPALTLALETLAIRSMYQIAPDEEQRVRMVEEQRAKIRHLEARFGPLWGGMGAVAEAFGLAWAAAGDRAAAVAKYQQALAANDGSASLKASEQIGNLQVRMAWAGVDKVRGSRDEAKRKLAALGKPAAAGEGQPRGKLEAALASGERALADAARAARKPIAEAIKLLDKLVALQPSMERENLCGSAYKRLAMVEAAAGQAQAEARAIKQMKQHYERAERLGIEGQLPGVFYPALNRIAAELVLNAGQAGWSGLDSGAVAAVRHSLATQSRDAPDFWSVVGLTELRLYEALARSELAAELAAIEAEYAELHTRVSSVGMWGSVYDQLRFVLPKYADRAPVAEKRAAESLLKVVEGFAGPPR